LTTGSHILPFAEGVVTCPLDGLALSAQANGTLACPRGHSFDRAREGYYNLLVVQHKASRDPGDGKPMVAARRRVLDSGLYEPITERVCEAVAAIARTMNRDRPLRILDAGCGEGSYLKRIGEQLARDGVPAQLAGIDISKWAVQAAAKRTPGHLWAVGTNRHLPFAPGTLDVIVCMFGFPVWAEFARVLAPGGRITTVDPGPDHLIELRSIIYDQVARNDGLGELPAGASQAGFAIARQDQAVFQVVVEGRGLIGDVLAMTPHDHRATLAGRQRLSACETLGTTADIVIRELIVRAD
jgi:23S rRNA (guanine745-N1)-methyltransferase